MQSSSVCYFNLLDLYHHPCYHRGSVHCLSWSRNFLLASVSSDQTINLLSYDPSYSPCRCNAQGQMTVHNGSLKFLPNDQLISGGVGDFALTQTFRLLFRRTSNVIYWSLRCGYGCHQLRLRRERLAWGSGHDTTPPSPDGCIVSWC